MINFLNLVLTKFSFSSDIINRTLNKTYGHENSDRFKGTSLPPKKIER